MKKTEAVLTTCKEYPWQAVGVFYCLLRIALRFALACCIYGTVHIIEKIKGKHICP